MSYFIDQLWKRNIKKPGARNLNCAVIGESGLGKSYGAMRICEEYYNQKLNMEFPVDNIVFTISEFIERINNLDKCSCIIFDDAGLKYSSARWYDELNQVLGYTLQSYRYRIINVFFTIPIKNWLDRIGRGMLHYHIDMKALGIGSLCKISYNQYQNKTYYRRYLIIKFDLPSKKLISLYEEKKDRFLHKEYNSYLRHAKLQETGDLSIDDIIDIILEKPVKYKLDQKFNGTVIQNELGISQNKAKQVLTILKYRGVLDEPEHGKLVCKQCGYTWLLRSGSVPKRCANPLCQSRKWDKG